MSGHPERHRRALAGFGHVVAEVGDRWSAPSPCSEWDARGVLEHVIGFHEVLVLRPLGVRANRPKDDPVGRWAATHVAIGRALDSELGDDMQNLLPALTTDVLIHTWDLARAAGVDGTLDPELSRWAYDAVLRHPVPDGSEMFGPPVAVPAGADLQTKLLAACGRRP